MAEYQFSKSEIDTSLLMVQINASGAIGNSTTGCTWDPPDTLTVSFAGTLTQNQQDALAALVAAHDASAGGFYQAIHKRTTPVNGRITKEEWYESCTSQGVVSGKAKSIDYTYSGSRLMSSVGKIYFKGGAVASSQTTTYMTVDGNPVERKV
jgi:hypothetical protein